MPRAKFKHARIGGITTAVGPEARPLREDPILQGADPQQTERLLKLIGIESRSVAPAGVTTLDLCECAARHLITQSATALADIDAVVFVTQTPDHFQPCNANLLHGRLGLGKAVAAFDINQGCSGWVYGLYVASSLVESGGCKKVLLLAGDTISQTINPRDRSAVLLFGDAGSATLVEYSEEPVESWFSLHSDGKGHDAIKIPAGAYRSPIGATDMAETTDAEGNVRRPDQLHMNGVEVLNFTLREEPAAIRELLEFAGTDKEHVDFFIFHQANRFIVQNLATRLKLPSTKVPCGTVGRFGNQSSASLPSVLCYELEKPLSVSGQRVLVSGFGVGLSWGTGLLWLDKLAVCQLITFSPVSGT